VVDGTNLTPKITYGLAAMLENNWQLTVVSLILTALHLKIFIALVLLWIKQHGLIMGILK
jgi:hypothetical protein